MKPSLHPSRFWNLVLVAAFLLLIGIVPVATLLGYGKASGTPEGRKLADPPSLANLRHPREFLSKISGSYNDMFAYRNRVLAAHSWLYYHLLNESISPKVLAAQDGWLFYGGENRLSVDLSNPLFQYRGGLLLNDRELSNVRDHVTAFRDEAARRSAKFLAVIVPNKEWVHPEQLPSGFNQPGQLTAIDQVQDLLRRDLNVDVLDLRPGLRQAAQRDQVYYAHDSHWNRRGAFVACNLILDHLHADFRSLRPYDPSRINWGVEKTRGDLFRMLSLEKPLEVAPLPAPPGGWQANETPPPFAIEPPPGFLHRWYTKASRLPAGEQAGLPSLLVFHDSYMETLEPFLSDAFAHSTYYWNNYDLVKLRELPDSYRPQVIIYEIAERALAGVASDLPAEVRAVDSETHAAAATTMPQPRS